MNLALGGTEADCRVEHPHTFLCDLLDCMVALPGKLLYGAQIAVCLWSLVKNKTDEAGSVSSGLTLRSQCPQQRPYVQVKSRRRLRASVRLFASPRQ
jgi:hypothetical protein